MLYLKVFQGTFPIHVFHQRRQHRKSYCNKSYKASSHSSSLYLELWFYLPDQTADPLPGNIPNIRTYGTYQGVRTNTENAGFHTKLITRYGAVQNQTAAEARLLLKDVFNCNYEPGSMGEKLLGFTKRSGNYILIL